MLKRVLCYMAVVLVATVFVSGCAHQEYSDTSPDAKLRVRILMDGADSLLLQGSKIWIKHHAYQLPGKYNGLDEPVVLNGIEWFPHWIGNTAEAFTGMDVFVPREDVEVTVKSLGQRGVVEVFEQPSADNDYTLTVSVDDRAPAGAAWYVIDIDW